ncbi:hypothetical protein GCM10010172_23690 [Paractinoplanes ferrugineus]|uniref:Uncharacterized protein n=1 Tax=Paractinoplanes ferrugineus TaxID=113564 RepID=A0A919IUF8_9ACTN|nr:hypothetical protein [Actinoplanes ferrugineus]GIE08720.1 hypothetical protein Afe05nite_05600 [Actinoplanes ferrugineus]
MFPSVQSERDDARVGDAHRFASEVERLAVLAFGGGRPLRLDRITGSDRTGTAFAVVDAFGRFVDVGLHPGWWTALGPSGVASGLLEALSAARLKAAIVPLILRRLDYSKSPIDVMGQHTPGNDALLEGIAEARRSIDAEQVAARIVTGRHTLFRLHVRGGRIDRAEAAPGLTADDTDALVADAREALAGR